MEQKQPHKSRSQGWGGLVPHPPRKPVERKLTPSCSHRTKLPPIRTYPVIEEKGYYSELLSTEASSQLPPCTQGPETQQSLLCQAGYESNTPKVTTFKTPVAFEDLLAKDRHGPSTQRLLQTDFAPGGYTAKVQLPFSCQPGELPRKLEIERRRRTYMNFDIDQLLKGMGIDSGDLMLRHQGYEEGQSGPENLGRPVFNYLPLEVFDNEEFDVRTPEDWLSLGYEEGTPDRKPVPAKALLPSRDDVPQDDPKKLKYCWQPVGVLDYDPEKQLYLVHKADCNRVRDAKGNPVVICGGQEAKDVGELQPGQYWVPRVRLNFIAEDPRVFAQRVQWAQRWRENTEALLLYHLAVDCMPVWSGSPSLDPACLSRVKQYALSTPGLKVQLLQECVSRLESEISLEYERTMNRINFDKVVTTCPEEFSHITLPQRDPEQVPESGLVPVPDYPLQQNRASFIRKTLLTKPEVINVLCNVRVQCSKVAAMSVFHIPFTKALRLDEFELAHSQTQSQLQLFLRDTWVPSLCSSIRYSLQDESMGWFCLSESSWEVYRLSKMYCLMSQIRFSLQDSLRFLVQDSLVGLGRLVLDACHSILSLPEDMVWGPDLINSPYKPTKYPMFLVDLVLDQTGVRYSTPLDNFEATLVSLFDKGILVTHNLPQLDKFVMKQMFISGTPQLQSVALWEPAVVEIREKIRTALRKATVPLKAYAREYERHLEVHNSDIATYIKAHSKPDQTPQEIKEEVDKHLQEKYRLDHTLPSSIFIGPFLVSVEATRQSLSSKRRGLANAVLDQFALRLRQQVDDSCAECKAISMKLFDKPNSIEELTEKRDWMKLIPEQVKGQEEFISKVVADYELIDEFFYNLSDGDFTAKWTAVGWPYKVLTQMEAVKIQHEEDEERFHKIQQVDQNNFQERLDSLQMLVAGFSAYTDIERTHEIANEVRRVSKQLKEAQGLAQLYNNRERLFGNPITNYDRLQKLTRDFQPFRDLWTTTSDWVRWQESWLNDPLSIIDPELLERNVSETYRTMHKCIKQFKDIPACQNVATNVRGKVEDFQPYIPLIQGLRNPGMRTRHWEVLSERISMNVRPKANFTLARCLEMGMQSHVEHIAAVAEIAGKEFAIEQALDKMEQEWSSVEFDVMPYKETGTHILKSPDEASQLLDDHIVMTQSMSFSPYKKQFEERISTWENKLRLTQDVLEEWLTCQRSWLYLEPIFSSEDINRQLPVEATRYQTMERTWRKVMKNAFENKQVISLCPDPHLLESLKNCNRLLEQVQKGLSEYLETKRGAFPRFYFLSDDELLEILSQTKDPMAVQPHLRKCFENVAKLQFQSDLLITHMYSGEGEEVQLFLPVMPSGNVEDWLREVEKSMKASLRDNIDRSLQEYPEKARTEWVLSWPGQVVIAGCQTFWTLEVSESLEQGDLADRLFPQLQTQLGDLVQLVRGRLSWIQRSVLSALIVIEVHAKDVAANLVEEGVSSVNDFEWISQLRYYWARNDLYVRAVNAEFLYGYEYLGNTGRLVITPLTDRCYLTLTGALHLKFGGAPAGPAGTGKTETTKDLGKALAIQTVVFNCSDQLDFIAMGKFLKGLASSGAWACFDEFNRIDVEVLSVVAQQITTIQKAQQQRAERFMFEGSEIPLVPSCAVFITMNPGYAGRTELPDNLKALFRPVAMMVPDYAMIAEISLYSFGFSDAKVLSKKITTTFKLSSEQLSSQDHYDFGMRAVKTVISAAGNLKRENPDMNEELICLRAIRDVNVPKFLQDDLKLFSGIVSDLFPKIREEPIDYGTLEESIRNTCFKKCLKDVDSYITKCIQLYETTVVRHGLMLVGPSGSGKTKCYEILGAAITALRGQPSVSGGVYEAVKTYVLNPKSITMGQLYGEFDPMTHEWTDGILSSLIRAGASSMDPQKKWYMFDGPVDAVWIENMNTVLDDNKKLCLSSGEIIKLSDVMTMMFEVQDLAVASPATVSRCGMVYLEPSILGLAPFTECWLRTIPACIQPYSEQLTSLFSRFLEDSIAFVRNSVKEAVTSMDSNLTCSLLKLLDCFFQPFIPREGEKPHPQEKLSRLSELIEPWFMFSLVWSVGCTGDADSYQKFNAWLRDKMAKENVALCFPEEGLVYDYRLDDAGISNPEEDEDETKRKVQWVSWMESAQSLVITPDTSYSDIIVPTPDTVRISFLMDMLLCNKKPVLCIGPTGTGKTLTMSDKLLKNMEPEYITHFLMFSARTSANQTQDFIDSKLDKRRKGVFGPPMGKYYIFFIDDLNMPMLETYGAQPPIELLRQFVDHGGWYDRKQIGTFKHLVDINFACAMGPPGGGRNPITQRFTRHFNFLSIPEMDDASKKKIFCTILGNWMSGNMSKKERGIPVVDIQPLNEPLVDATIKVYSTITSQLLPSPAKSHYTFNLRDLSKVFQGILMGEASMFPDKVKLLQLWYHESCRVFQDRLVCAEDRQWFDQLLQSCIEEFECSFEEVVPSQPVLFGDFMVPNAANKVYQLIEDRERLVTVMEEYMEDYNQISTTKMRLVLFMDAVQHICRISRIIRQPLGNALLLGVGGSGRQSLTKMATHMADYECFQIELSKNYGQAEWRDDIKGIMLKAGLQNEQITFLFVDTQIKCESFLEDVNNILNSGDVPNLYASDEQDRILVAMKPVVQDLGQQPTKSNLMAAYIKRVRSNIHTVLCMSPIGEVFRARLRQFPSLVTCCTIDWFSAWPEEALESVANSFLGELPELEAEPAVLKGLTMMCMDIHQTVARKCDQYLAELSRHNYVTPKSYLDLLAIFSSLIGRKKQELHSARQRMKIGLDKLLHTADDVSKMQEELEVMRPLLEEAAQDTLVTMEKIKEDTAVAEVTRVEVQAEEAKASEKAHKAHAIATDAQKDLDEALPALDAALDSLKSLNKNDVTEVRAMQRPPQGVKLVIEALCIIKGIKPKKVPGEKPGTKVDDYWEPGKGLLQDPGKFLEGLFKFDKENIPDSVIKLVQPYIDNEEFQPESIAKVSKACKSICQWVRAMHIYHFVAKGVEPKRQALKEAQEDLAATQKILDEAMGKLAAVEEGIAALEAKYRDCLAKRDELDNKCSLCEARLVRADKLIGGLAGEKVRWAETVEELDYMVNNVSGDVLLAAGYVAYLGPFTGEYRADMAKEWLQRFKELGVPHTSNPDLISTLGDKVKIRSWQITGLPKDSLSVENGVITQYSPRWPLFIDPQGQANKWIKNMERENGLDVMKLSDRDFLRSLENAIRFGKPCLLENVGEELDPALEPVLLRETFKQQGSTVIKLGDTIIPYHDDFKMYITTKLPNPHYSPEISTKVTLINFTLSPSGLEDQLLGCVVAEERPDLEEAKNQLIVSSARMKQELKEIEDQILFRLSSVEGNPVDDEELIRVLGASKVKAGEIEAKVMVAEETERDIDATRLEYVPVAVRTQILFFCVSDLSNVDPMYQYSLEWFLGIFMSGIANSEKADTVEKRIVNINEFFTFSLYSNVCRSLFEKHKLMFAFLLCVRIMMNENKIDMAEWRYMLSGGMAQEQLPNPAEDWLSSRAWQDILGLSSLPTFSSLAADFQQHEARFREIFDSSQPHREPLPGEWDTQLDSFQKLLILRCLRADRLTHGMQDFVAAQLGQRFIEPQTSDLSVVFKESSPSIPLIFVLSPGTDPAADLYKFADVMKFSKKMSAISLGQGQGPWAEAMMHKAMDKGHWVFFQNCHLAPSWMPSLERLIENIDPNKVHRDFRLWLTSLPSNKFPVSILQNGSKMTIEPPRGIKANLLKTYLSLSEEFFNSCSKARPFKSLLFSLCLFHGNAIERRKFGPLGFNIPYEFTDGDLRICISQLKMFLDEYQDTPYKVLRYTAGQINYGGRVTDDWDRRCILNILEDFYCPAVLTEDYAYSPSGEYRQICTDNDIKGYLEYIRSLPINDTPEIFGLHDNANISFAQNETFALLGAVVKLQPKAAASGGKGREEIVEEIVTGIKDKVPEPISIEEVMTKYPILYEESMNTVLIQEVIRYNRLLVVISQSLSDLVKALKGLVVMSSELELMANSLFNNTVPDMWNSKAYPSLKPLSSWVMDLLQRISFVQGWISDGIPAVFWISGFFFPQAFLTGTLQNFARRSVLSIDTIGFDFKVMKESAKELRERPDMGCYIHGLFLEGARWDAQAGCLTESRPKELYTEMGVIWMVPEPNRKPPLSGVYVCPIYKTLTRAGTLSTTGHSTNYVIAVELPTDRTQRHWIKQGVALICALDY
ncbi:dynein heavy chain 1, axonemal isoform X1 [Anguilla anguilla]|uniref:dynein heavy chain 1, axonemal isoform X1 n=1 Tax=Anguilla anguilla TaxID=7936 RepID=UPI0015A91136|nr:dynein heavy chain 1, axonemal isoform X1 [Anguilla anguilla]XP_035245197.1 dynein heavy chain 1, axonemal isoform X1 [Anguilla anguilla]